MSLGWNVLSAPSKYKPVLSSIHAEHKHSLIAAVSPVLNPPAFHNQPGRSQQLCSAHYELHHKRPREVSTATES